jgi:hypothetical protein
MQGATARRGSSPLGGLTTPKPTVQPRWTSLAETPDAEEQAHGEERSLNDGRDEKIPR